MRKRKMIKCGLCLALSGILLLGAFGQQAAATESGSAGGTEETTKAVDFTRVQVTDEFWSARQRQIVCVTVPAGIANVEKSGGGISNMINAGKKNRGESYGDFEGAIYVDSDVHKLVEAMCYALQLEAGADEQVLEAQSMIRAKLEEWIPYYQAAQESDGYFDTYFTLARPDAKYNCFNDHELYCAGHLYEAAVAHYRMSGGTDTRLLDIAVKNANHICSLFGEGKWKAVPGHQEIELALLKLASLCKEIGVLNGYDYAARAADYIEMASFFLRTRGDHEERHGVLWDPELVQDDKPITKQTEILGHAVRAHYMCIGMADLELMTEDDTYRQSLQNLWDSAQTKTYVTGAVGVSDHTEGYGPDKYMPIDKCYGETCASISSMMWNQRMSMLFGDSKYADEMEQQLYNNILSGINLSGDRFFYENHVSTAGRERVEWYGTACCPPNLMRTVLSLGGYVYTQQQDTVTMNLYVGNEADFNLTQGEMHLSVTSGFPWNGKVSIKASAAGERRMKLRLRLPSWANGENTLIVNGESVGAGADGQGYIVLDRVWKNGDTIVLELPMEVQSVDLVEGTEAAESYTAFRRGPVVYCAEEVDNENRPNQYYIAKDAAFEYKWVENLDGKADPYGVRGMVTITTKDAKLPWKTEGAELKMIPYYANANRGATGMEVYISLKSKGRLEVYGTPSASHTYAGNHSDSVDNLNDENEDPASRWTSYKDNSLVIDPWVMYTFSEPVYIRGCEVLWFDDGGGVQIPDGLTIEYWDGEKFVEVVHGEAYTDFPANTYGTYTFSQVKTSKIRMTMHNAQKNRAVGIVEWRLMAGSCEHAVTEIRGEKAATYTEKGYTGDTVCVSCGTIIEKGQEIPMLVHVHTYNGYSYDETNHWKECMDCPEEDKARKDMAPHEFDDDTDTTCNVCGYIRTISQPAEPEQPIKPEQPTEPEQPMEPDSKGENLDSNAPRTGEESNIMLWIAVLLSGIGAISLGIKMAAKKKEM